MPRPVFLAIGLFLQVLLYDPCLAADSVMDVSFPAGHDDLQLEGKLVHPCLGCDEASPGVVLLHGSGPHSRDGTVPLSYGFSISVFEEIAKALVDNGIAVFTYDKRSCGTFNNCNNNDYPLPDANLTVNDFMADGAAAIDYLQSRSDIESVVAVGHSQGASFVPILLESNPELVGGVMLAGVFRPIDEVIPDQFAYQLQTLLDLGFNESMAQTQLQPSIQAFEGLEALRNGSTTPVAGATATFWRSWFDMAPQAKQAAAETDQPLLILNGLLDNQAFPSEAEAWADYLEGVGRGDVQLELLPCITHVMNCVNATSLVNATDEQVGRHVDETVTTLLTDFVKAAAASSAGRTETPSSSVEDTPSEPTTTDTPSSSNETSAAAGRSSLAMLQAGWLLVAYVLVVLQ